jgi:cation:H+ antiporter
MYKFVYIYSGNNFGPAMNDYNTLTFSIIFAGVGGEAFIRGSVRIASSFRVSQDIISTTIAAFTTSNPELSVSINPAISGVRKTGSADAFSSNVVNIALILALALHIYGGQSPRDKVKREFPVANRKNVSKKLQLQF